MAIIWSFENTGGSFFTLPPVLERLGSFGAAVAAKTITLFHADHGYQLGELNEWSKKTDTELATRVPMIIRVRHTICRLSRFGAGLLR